MRLYSRLTVRRLRRAVRGRLRASPEMWRRYKRHRARRRPLQKASWLAWAMFSLVVFAGLEEQTGGRLAVSTLLVCLAGAEVFWQASNMMGLLYRTDALAAVYYLPLPEEDFFRMQFRQFLVRPVRLVVVALVVNSWLVASEMPRALPLVVLVAVLHWAAVVALALVASRNAMQHGNLPALIFILPSAAVLIWPEVRQAVHQAVTLLPAGWLQFALEALVHERWASGLAALAAVAGVVALWPVMLRKIRAEFVAGFKQPPPSRIAPVEAEPPAGALPQPAPSPAEATAENEPGAAEDWTEWVRARKQIVAQGSADVVLRGGLEFVPDWKAAGWVEALASRWLSDEEREIAEFMLGDEFGKWSKSWRLAAYVAGGAALLALVPFVPAWIPIVAAGISMVIGCPAGGGQWAAFTLCFGGGELQIPFLAAYPLSYREMSRAIMKVNSVRILLWLAPGLAMAVAIGWKLGAVASAVQFVLCLAYALMVLQPMLVAGKISSGTNDASIRSVRQFFFLAVLGSLAIPLAVGGFAFLLWTMVVWEASPGLVMALGALLPASSFGFWWIYEKFFHHGRVDQIVLPRR